MPPTPSNPPVGTAGRYSSRTQHAKARRPAPPPEPRKMSESELDELKAFMKEQLGGKEPRDFQVELTVAQEERRDGVAQAATGMGKTAIAAGPYALEKNVLDKRTTLMVSPLIGLQDEMAETFRDEYGLTATAINSAHGGCSAKLMQEIVEGEYRIVLLSPEMLVSRRFIDGVLRKPEFASRVYSLIVDEAHCISHWGVSFRKKYGLIGSVRIFLPRNTPVIAVSASLTRRVTRDIMDKLQISRATCYYRNLGNNRPNVSLVVRAIHNTQQSFSDLDFVIPSTITSPADIPKTWIYCDGISTGLQIIDHLRTLLPSTFEPEIIRPYNAIGKPKYRKQAMDDFREGEIRILVCTDAAGMGCNIPDIDVVVQWKLPGKLSSFVQRAGRAARGPGRTGLAVLLVEPATYSVLLTEGQTFPETADEGGKATKKGKGKGKGSQKKKKQKLPKDYARVRGRFRGGRTEQDDLGSFKTFPFDPQDPTEGLYLFVQSPKCRRLVLRAVFENPPSESTVPCCDICDPTLLDRTRPGVRPRTQSAIKIPFEKEKSCDIEDALEEWREEVLTRPVHTGSFLSPGCILPDDAIAKLSLLPRPVNHAHVAAFLSPQWLDWPIYKREILDIFDLLERLAAERLAAEELAATEPAHEDDASTAPTSPPQATNPQKRPQADSALATGSGDQPSKRPRTAADTAPSSSVLNIPAVPSGNMHPTPPSSQPPSHYRSDYPTAAQSSAPGPYYRSQTSYTHTQRPPRAETSRASTSDNGLYIATAQTPTAHPNSTPNHLVHLRTLPNTAHAAVAAPLSSTTTAHPPTVPYMTQEQYARYVVEENARRRAAWQQYHAYQAALAQAAATAPAMSQHPQTYTFYPIHHPPHLANHIPSQTGSQDPTQSTSANTNASVPPTTPRSETN